MGEFKQLILILFPGPGPWRPKAKGQRQEQWNFLNSEASFYWEYLSWKLAKKGKMKKLCGHIWNLLRGLKAFFQMHQKNVPAVPNDPFTFSTRPLPYQISTILEFLSYLVHQSFTFSYTLCLTLVIFIFNFNIFHSILYILTPQILCWMTKRKNFI